MTDLEFTAVIQAAVKEYGYRDVSKALGVNVPLISIHHWNAGQYLPVMNDGRRCSRQDYAERLSAYFRKAENNK